MIHKLEHVGIMAKDMDASIKFYTEVLGMRLVGRVQLSSEKELSFLSYSNSENIELELITNPSNEIPSRGLVDHVAFTVTDIDSEVERLKNLGVSMIDESPKTILEGTKIAFFYGPNGERLEFFQK